MTGVLTLVSTPIGNLGDLAPRAVEALEAADLVCCEDTRRTGSLLKQIGVRVDELRRLDDHTEFESIPVILDRLVAGERVVLVSDAGTPGISDPGERLVAAVAEAGIEVTTVPGPVAAIAALVSSGLPSGRFVFEGFLARKGQERSAQLEAIAVESRTTVFYESPNRVAATLAALAEACGPDRRAVIARELTKLHEELRRGTLAELALWASAGVKGEVVVVVDGADTSVDLGDGELVERLRAALAEGCSKRDAVDRVVAATGARRGRVYDLSLTI
ncbi:MAG: 16S rRNA (cytidine(1402)-2'-O)-methyltransferase [Actinobacteria bacterium]|jgi:16S rRNA (cytidine1402-2'-O)-methyltransferase|nr:16S rRNA (cytidine(1402)-2'-O)-methyltransferase [Acidimicrobiia bacterium]NDH96385.1 16S rRNA (cytidine(1402)-2'-O)-methyltransferase [Actinomycetota bacterium]